MRSLWFILLTAVGEIQFISPAALAQSGGNKFSGISGTITFASDYCGGVDPDEETLKNISTPRPETGKKLYIRKGKFNDVSRPLFDSVVTDAEGKYYKKLPPGNYCLLLPEQKDSSAIKRWRKSGSLVIHDEKCLSEWFSKGLASFEVTKEKEAAELNFHFHRRCFLPEGVNCIYYDGPYPP